MEKKNSFNPVNLDPEWFLLAPTAIPTRDEVIYGAKHAAKDLGRKGKLLLGTEFEMLFFSPDSDPEKSYQFLENPNYHPSHLKKIEEITRDAVAFTEKQRRMDSCEIIGRLSLEYRTRPLDVKDMLAAYEDF